MTSSEHRIDERPNNKSLLATATSIQIEILVSDYLYDRSVPMQRLE